MNLVNGFVNTVVSNFNLADTKVSALASGAWNAAPNLIRAPLSAAGGFALSAIAKAGAGLDYIGVPATSFVATHNVAIITGLKVIGALAAIYTIVKIAKVCLKLIGQGLTAAGKAIHTQVYGNRDATILQLTIERDAANDQRDAAIRERDAARGERDTAIGERNTALGERNTALGERNTAIGERDAARGALDTARAQMGTLTKERDTARAQVETLTQERDAANGKLDAVKAELVREDANDADKGAAIAKLFVSAETEA